MHNRNTPMDFSEPHQGKIACSKILQPVGGMCENSGMFMKTKHALNDGTRAEIRVALFCRFPFRRWYTYFLAEALARNGVSVRLYGPKSNSEKGHYYEKVWHWWSYPLDILKKARMDDIDIIHIQFELPTFKLFGAFLLPLCILLLRFMGIKCIITIHGPILPLGKKGEMIVKDLVPDNLRWAPAKIIVMCLRLLYISVERTGAIIIVHGHTARQWLLRQGLKNVYVIAHGVNLPKINKEHSKKTSSIICFGTISPRKGIENFILAIYKMSDYLMSRNFDAIIAGYLPHYYAEYARSLERLITDLKLNKLIKLRYNLRDEEVNHYLNKAYVAVLPYKLSVSSSGALSTLFEHGIPTLVADTEYFCEIVGSDFIGVFKKESPEQLADKLFMVLSTDKFREKILQQMIDRLSPHKWDIVASETRKLYMKMLSKSKL